MSLGRFGFQLFATQGKFGFQRVILSNGLSQCTVYRAELESNTSRDIFQKKSFLRVRNVPTKDRSETIPVEKSIRYLKSEAYKTTYGTDPVWKMYRRNHKGQIPPEKTRRTCIRGGVISTGNPCPICRDEYLVFDHHNIDLLKQFISSFNGEIISYNKTNICQMQHRKLLIALYRAKNFGTLTFEVPFREYNYQDWYTPETKEENTLNTEDKNTIDLKQESTTN